jgi:hypothetical protein
LLKAFVGGGGLGGSAGNKFYALEASVLEKGALGDFRRVG